MERSLLLVLIWSLAACSTVEPYSKTEHASSSDDAASVSKAMADNMLKVHSRMSSDKILKMFGKPKTVSQAVCGSAGERWVCTTWTYGKAASFTFNADNPRSLILNHFEIDTSGE